MDDTAPLTQSEINAATNTPSADIPYVDLSGAFTKKETSISITDLKRDLQNNRKKSEKRIEEFNKQLDQIEISEMGLSLTEYLEARQNTIDSLLNLYAPFAAREFNFTLDLDNNPQRMKVLIEQFYILDIQKSGQLSSCKPLCDILSEALSLLLQRRKPTYIEEIMAYDSRSLQSIIQALPLPEISKLIWTLKRCVGSEAVVETLESVSKQKAATLDDKINQFDKKEISKEEFVDYAGNLNIINLKSKLRGHLSDAVRDLLKEIVEQRKVRRTGGDLFSTDLLNDLKFTCEEMLSDSERNILRGCERTELFENEECKYLRVRVEDLRETLRISLEQTWQSIINPLRLKIFHIRSHAIALLNKEYDDHPPIVIKLTESKEKMKIAEQMINVRADKFVKKLRRLPLKDYLQMSFDEAKARIITLEKDKEKAIDLKVKYRLGCDEIQRT